MISRTARYALNVLGHLADRPGAMVRGEEIAQQTGIPANYLSKILNQLRKAGLVESQKGWGGGFRLHADAPGRPIKDVVEIFDGPGSTIRDECAFGRPQCDPQNPCVMHDDWMKVRQTYEDLVSSRRVADLGSR
ncbi:MAG: Rrf2 family transcriptional regulator [Candidatus Krumholzibacteriia bacterium]